MVYCIYRHAKYGVFRGPKTGRDGAVYVRFTAFCRGFSVLRESVGRKAISEILFYRSGVTMASDYTVDKIKIMEGLDAVRMRPGMYIGSTGQRGLHHLLWEIMTTP
jgi:hypothetical protein